MNSIGIFHKRKSFSKVQPQLPIRKISQHSREYSRKKHRTEYQTLDSPQAQLKNYKRKNFKLLNQIQQSSPILNLQKMKEILSTDRTLDTYLKSEERIDRSRNENNISINSFKNDSVSKIKKNVIEQPTSRFNYEHNDTDLMTQLININKSKDSNPLINTARLNQKTNFKPRKSSGNQSSSIQQNKISEIDISNSRSAINNSLSKQTDSVNNQGIQIENEQVNEQEIEEEGEKFDDYIFGGQAGNKDDLAKNGQIELKKKKKKLMPPPKVQSYTIDSLNREKSENWRQKNRYQPQTEEEHRMALQTFNKQKQKLQYYREQKELNTIVQEYNLNKNAILTQSKRKIQSNKILQKIYEQKRHQSHSLSLPQLKKFENSSLPKKEIILPQVNEFNQEENSKQTENCENIKIKNLLAKNVQNQKKDKKLNRSSKYTFSLSRLGFGAREPRKLFQDEIIQTEFQNIQKIEMKLRQKGITFNPNNVRKSLINMRDIPTYKLSTLPLGQKKMDLPSKQLPSNQFYKVFPL